MEKYRTHIIILILNALFCIGVLNLPFKAKLYGDNTFHNEAKIASSILKGKSSPNNLMITWAPGPVLFYAIPYTFVASDTDHAYWIAGTIWNMLFLSIASWYLLASVILLTNNRGKTLFLALLLIIPLQLYYGFSIIAETMAFCGCCLFLFGITNFIKGKYGKHPSITFIAGLLMMVLSRPNTILVFGFIPLILAWLYFRKDMQYRILVKKLIFPFFITCALFIATIFIVKRLPTNQNKTNQENLFLLVNHIGRFQFRTELTDWRFWDSDCRADSKDYIDFVKSVIELDEKIVNEKKTYNEVYEDWLIHDIISHPSGFAIQTFVRVIYGNYLQINSVSYNKLAIGPISGKTTSFLIHLVLNLINLGIIIMAVFGFKNLYAFNKATILLILPYVALLLFHSLIYMEQRYLYPARPIILLLATNGILNLLKHKFQQVKQ